MTTGQTIGTGEPLVLGVAEVNGTVFGGMAEHGGPCDIDNLPAGTYTVSVQFKASSGSVTASNRRLRVQVISFS